VSDNVYGVGQRSESPYAGVVSIFADRTLRGGRSTSMATGAKAAISFTWTTPFKLCSRH